MSKWSLGNIIQIIIMVSVISMMIMTYGCIFDPDYQHSFDKYTIKIINTKPDSPIGEFIIHNFFLPAGYPIETDQGIFYIQYDKREKLEIGKSYHVQCTYRYINWIGDEL